MKKIFTLLFNVNTYHPGSNSSHQSFNNDQLHIAPDHCVQNIMNFARSYRVEETQAAGKIEMILN